MAGKRGSHGRRPGSLVLLSIMAMLFVAGTPALAAEQGLSGKKVKLGAFVPKTGPASYFTKITTGAEAYFKWVNDQGGINGYTFEYILRDDGYETSRTVAVTRQLVEEDKVFALVAPTGTPTNAAVVDYLTEAGIPVVGPVAALEKFHKPFKRNFFTLLPSYLVESQRAAQYVIDTLAPKKLALVYQNDDLGKPALDGVTAYLKTRSLRLATSLPYPLTENDFSAYAGKLKEAGADCVIFWGVNRQLASLLKESDKIGFKPKWMVPFFNADPVTFDLAGDLIEGVYFDTWLLPPTAENPRAKDFIAAMNRYFPKESKGVFNQNGWTNAAVFGEGVRRATEGGKALTREGLLAALESMKGVPVGLTGPVTFTPTNHRGLNLEAILQAKGGKLVVVEDFKPIPNLVGQ